jgi:hypothetical protein
VLLVGAWLVAGVTSVFVAASTAVGPTILTVDDHTGAQTGDLAFALAAAGGAVLMTRRLAPVTGADIRGGLVVLTWLLAGFLTLIVAAETSVGPVLLVLTRRHGVHSGDAAFGLAAAGVAAVVTHLLLSPLRDRRTPLPSTEPR